MCLACCSLDNYGTFLLMSFEANLLRITRRRKYREKLDKEFPQTTLENYN